MAYFRDPNFATEPFQDDTPQAASTSELKAFYDAQSKQALPRKAPMRMSSLWSRKVSTSKRSQSTSLPTKGSQSSVDLPLEHHGKAEPAKPLNQEAPPLLPAVSAPIVIRSLVPDTLKELPAWYNREEHGSTAFFRTRFPMHNPVGPRFYRNFHLIPPSARPGANRPPSVFSPSFPAMSAATLQERSEDSTRISPARTPSESPMPTPNSSQTRVGEGKPRTRRPSQDNVDMMDVSDPWGQAWHHESPYDVGLAGGSASDDARARRMSMSNVTDQRHRTVTPSPLSQSTSAVHLHHLPNTEPRIPRRLSKRRPPVVHNLFDGSQRVNDSSSHLSPMNGDADGQNSVYPMSSRQSTRTSSFLHVGTIKVKPPSLGSKEKRGSVLGRLVKRFSIMRRPASEDYKQKTRPVIPTPNRSTSTFSIQREPVTEPQEDLVPPIQDQYEQPNRNSIGSFEASFSMGRLTVANPDSTSTETTPRNGEADLPLQRHEPSYETEVRPTTTSIVSPPFAVMTLSRNGQVNDQRNDNSLHTHEPIYSHSRPVPVSNHEVSDVETMASPVMSSPVQEASSPIERRPSSQYGDHERSRVRPQGGRKPSLSSKRTSGEQRRSSVDQKQPSQRQQSRSPEKQKSPAPPVPQPKAAVTVSSVSFPEERAADRAYIAALVSTHGGMQDSPMSNASILANPPTPYNDVDLPMPSTPGPPVPSKSPFPMQSKTLPSNNHPSTTSRETETFKLVRSLSGNVYSSGETIMAAGQQWEIIEDKRGREGSSQSHSKSRSRDAEAPRKSSRKTRESGDKARSPPPAPAPAPVQPSELSAESAESRSRSREHKRAHKKSGSSTGAVHGSSVSPSKVESSRPLARNPSSSARPTSEVPNSADLNATRAREAWEMERLWKGRSMYGGEGNSIPISAVHPYPQQYPEIPSPPSSSNDRAGPGSGHTSFTQQKPLYSRAPNPLPEPPRESTFIPVTSPLPNAYSNPLPEPPQESPYPISPVSLYEANSTRSSEYWNRLTTAH